MGTKKEGNFKKWTNYLGSWQNRYFVFNNGILSYYKENPVNSSSSCRGAISVYDASFKETKNFGIDVLLKDCSWYLRADNVYERNQWMKAFQECKRQKALSNLDANLNKLITQQTRPHNLWRNIKTKSSPTAGNPTEIPSSVALGDIMDSRKTLEEKVASWKEAHSNGNATQLLSRNPKEIFLDKHVPQALKCPICFDVFANIVYQCQEGHSVCSVCFGRMTCCPLCQKRYGLNKMRNRLIEDLASTQIMSCPGSNYGCKYKGNIKSLENHVSGCVGFVIGEKLAQESNDENSNGLGSLPVFPGNDMGQNQSQQGSLEPSYLTKPVVLFFIFFCGVLFKHLLDFWVLE